MRWPAAPPGDPRRDFVTVSADYVDEKSFVASVSRIAKQTRRTRALIFVHGSTIASTTRSSPLRADHHDSERGDTGLFHLAIAR